MNYDLTNVNDIKLLCKKFGFTFKKALGQNFLLDIDVIEKICHHATSQNVLEIGPGFGVLTSQLLKHNKKVISIELDQSLNPLLSDVLKEHVGGLEIWDGVGPINGNPCIVNGDVLKLNLKEIIGKGFVGSVSVAANLPYYITTPIIINLLTSGLFIDNIVITVQKEVAERIVAPPGIKDYGALTVLCNYYGKPEIIEIIPRESFFPVPSVDSAVVNIKMPSAPTVSPANQEFFFKVVKASFAQRRKTLVNALANGGISGKEQVKAALSQMSLDENIRGERLSIQQFSTLSDML